MMHLNFKLLIRLSSLVLLISFSPVYHKSKGNLRKSLFQHHSQLRSPDDVPANAVSDIAQPVIMPNQMIKHAILQQTALLVSCLAGSIVLPADSLAATTEDLFVDDVTTTPKVIDPLAAARFAADVEKTRPLNSDEYVVKFENISLGLGLTETYYKGFPVVTITSIKYPLNNKNDPEFRASNPLLKIGGILVGVQGNSTDGIPLKKISELIRTAPRPVDVKFRDPSRYFQLLDSTVGPPLKVITTSYLPANARDPGAPEQIIRVERLEMPPPEDRRRASVMLDVMEIQYVAQLPGKEAIVDSSKERTSGSSSGSIYYILGQQNGPPGKLPPGWDLSLRGMVVGEKRRITLPYTLAYDRAGSKDKKIPPFSPVVYTVRLVSLT